MTDMHVLTADGKRQVPEWTLGDRLRKAREHAGFTRQQDIAAELRVSRSAVAGWENGTHAPSFLALREWARITDVPIAWLEDGSMEPDGDGGGLAATGPSTSRYWDRSHDTAALELVAA